MVEPHDIHAASPWAPPRNPLRTRIVAGLILIIPVAITFWVVHFIFSLLRDASLWLIEAYLKSPAGAQVLAGWGVTAESVATEGIDALPTLVRWALACLAVLLTIVLIYVLGGATANVAGRQFVRVGERLMGHIPIVKTIYGASKQVMEVFAGDSAKAFRKVVSVPFPTAAIRSIAFVTGSSRDVMTGDELYVVMLANPMTGFIFVVKKSEVVELNWTVEEAVKMMMSGGMLTPQAMPFEPSSPRA